MSIDRKRVAAVEELEKHGFVWKNGGWHGGDVPAPVYSGAVTGQLSSGSVIPVPAAPQTYAGKCTKHAATQLFADLKHQDTQFAVEMKNLFYDLSAVAKGYCPTFNVGERFINILHSAFDRNSI